MDKLKSVGGFVGGKVKNISSAAVNAPADLVSHNIGKEKVKVKFEITLKSANNLEPQFNGRNVFIEWKRGSNKERTGTDADVVPTSFLLVPVRRYSCPMLCPRSGSLASPCVFALSRLLMSRRPRRLHTEGIGARQVRHL